MTCCYHWNFNISWPLGPSASGSIMAATQSDCWYPLDTFALLRSIWCFSLPNQKHPLVILRIAVQPCSNSITDIFATLSSSDFTIFTGIRFGVVLVRWGSKLESVVSPSFTMTLATVEWQQFFSRRSCLEADFWWIFWISSAGSGCSASTGKQHKTTEKLLPGCENLKHSVSVPPMGHFRSKENVEQMVADHQQI